MPSELATKVKAIRDSLRELDETRAALQAELDEIVEAAGVSVERRRGRPKTKTGRRPLREGSVLYLAKKVLEQRGMPWYIDDLLKDVRDLSGKSIQKTSLVSSLSRYIRAGDTFTRPREGYYGLIEFDLAPDGVPSN